MSTTFLQALVCGSKAGVIPASVQWQDLIWPVVTITALSRSYIHIDQCTFFRADGLCTGGPLRLRARLVSVAETVAHNAKVRRNREAIAKARAHRQLVRQVKRLPLNLLTKDELDAMYDHINEMIKEL